MSIFFGKYFRLTLIFILFLEILSFCGYLYSEINTLVFFVISFFAFVLSLKKLEYGLYILLVELFIGSKGYLFSFEINGINLSIRIALFLIIISVWFSNLLINRFILKKKLTNFSNQEKSIYIPYLALFLFIVWGLIWGLIRNNTFENIFFDFNAWLYFLLIFPFLSTFKSWKQLESIFQIFTASLITQSLKTLFVFYAFSHYWTVGLGELYSWIRSTGIGEITQLKEGFHRIFFQSHLYLLIGFFVFLIIFLNKKNITEESRQQLKIKNLHFLLVFFFSLPVLISFSRSFWVGTLAGLFFLFFWIGFEYFKKRKFPSRSYKIFWFEIFKLGSLLILLFVLQITFIWALINFPKPKRPIVDFSLMAQERITTSPGEAAGISRLNLLRPLFREIFRHPIVGSGFGTTVTYQSSDPRILTSAPEGWYTTYAFEWGYLDIWLKIGLIGLLVYLWLIWTIWQKGWQIIKEEKSSFASSISLGMLLGLLAIFVTNIFSPYLNHPLGIGYLMLCSLVFQVFEKEQIGYPE